MKNPPDLTRQSLHAVLEQRLRERAVARLDRSGPSSLHDLHRKHIADHLTTFTHRQLSELAVAVDDPVREDEAIGLTGFQNDLQLRNHFVDRFVAALDRPMKALDFTVTDGSRIIGTPYDVDWGTGGGFAFGGRFDGKAVAFGLDGASTAAIGFHVSSPDELSVAITPLGRYEWSWFSVQGLPGVRSRGGLGMTVYLNDNPQPIASTQAVLWRVSGVPSGFHGDAGSGSIADAASPASGFGPVPIAPVFLNTGPNLRYLVWVWCWQVCAGTAGNSFLSLINMKMPAVRIDAGPPMHLH
jgi:hypothetical protein